MVDCPSCEGVLEFQYGTLWRCRFCGEWVNFTPDPPRYVHIVTYVDVLPRRGERPHARSRGADARDDR